jgi:hypothetical protein
MASGCRSVDYNSSMRPGGDCSSSERGSNVLVPVDAFPGASWEVVGEGWASWAFRKAAAVSSAPASVVAGYLKTFASGIPGLKGTSDSLVVEDRALFLHPEAVSSSHDCSVNCHQVSTFWDWTWYLFILPCCRNFALKTGDGRFSVFGLVVIILNHRFSCPLLNSLLCVVESMHGRALVKFIFKAVSRLQRVRLSLSRTKITS